jgi:hypothetical protein
MPKIPHKPTGPGGVKMTIGAAIEESRGVPRKAEALSNQELVKNILATLHLPEVVKRQLREQYHLD